MQHRVAPAPVSSGLSFRALPEATLVQIIKSCQHYEAKLASSPAASSPAGRLVYELSRDVQDLVRVLKLREDAQAGRIRDLETLLREFRDVCERPHAALQAAGVSAAAGSNTPAALARIIVQQHAQLTDVRSAAGAGATLAEKEVHDLRLALRDASRHAREQAAAEIMRVKADADAVIALERSLRQDAEAGLRAAQQAFDEDVAVRVRDETDAATASLREQVLAMQSRMDATVQTSRSESKSLSRELQAALTQVHQLQDSAAAQQAAAEERVRELGDSLRAASEAAARATDAHREDLKRIDAEWRRVVQTEREAWQRSTAASRVAGMEAQIAFLTARLTDVERLADTLQRALHGGAHAVETRKSTERGAVAHASALHKTARPGAQRGLRPATASVTVVHAAAPLLPVATRYAWIEPATAPRYA